MSVRSEPDATSSAVARPLPDGSADSVRVGSGEIVAATSDGVLVTGRPGGARLELLPWGGGTRGR